MSSSSLPATETILFTRGVPAVEALPNNLIAECLQAVLTGPEGRAILQYGHNGGYMPLRKLLAEQYAVAPEQVLVGNGSLHLQDLLSALLITPGATVLVEQPSYDRVVHSITVSAGFGGSETSPIARYRVDHGCYVSAH